MATRSCGDGATQDGCMGVAIPYGLGMQMVKPEKQVSMLSGDGALGMQSRETDTACPGLRQGCGAGRWSVRVYVRCPSATLTAAFDRGRCRRSPNRVDCPPVRPPAG